MAEEQEESELAEHEPREVRRAHGPLAAPEKFVPAVEIHLIEGHLEGGSADGLGVFPRFGRIWRHGDNEGESFVDPVALCADGEAANHRGCGEHGDDHGPRKRMGGGSCLLWGVKLRHEALSVGQGFAIEKAKGKGGCGV